MHPFVKFFLAIWFAGVLIFGGLAFQVSRSRTISGNFGDDSTAATVVPVVMLAFGVILLRFGSRLGRQEKVSIMGWLQRSFTDTTENPHS